MTVTHVSGSNSQSVHACCVMLPPFLSLNLHRNRSDSVVTSQEGHRLYMTLQWSNTTAATIQGSFESWENHTQIEQWACKLIFPGNTSCHCQGTLYKYQSKFTCVRLDCYTKSWVRNTQQCCSWHKIFNVKPCILNWDAWYPGPTLSYELLLVFIDVSRTT